MGKTVKTKPSDLKYVFITGEGRNQALPGQPERMQFVATVIMKKDGPQHKFLKEQIDEEWAEYKTANNIKGLPKTNGIKPEMIKDPKGTIDPETEKTLLIPTDNVTATFKTNTLWPNGNDQVVKVYDGKGEEVTKIIHNAKWSIGEGSRGVIHGMAVGNDAGGNQKVTLYLSGIQLTKLVKYEGTNIETEDLSEDSEDLGLDAEDTIAAVEDNEENTPKV